MNIQPPSDAAPSDGSKQESQYGTYTKWKGWRQGNRIPKWQAKYFASELSYDKPHIIKSLLEIGFGNGELLQWCKRNGIQAVGLEIIPELVANAEANGFDVYLHSISEPKSESLQFLHRTYDCIVAFDVFEHLDNEGIRAAFGFASNLLNPNGKLIIRFPNGESPFSLPFQNGDATHATYLSQSKLEQLSIGTDLQLVAYRNPRRVINRPLLAIPRGVSFLLRTAVELALGFTYFGKWRPLDPSAIAVFRRTADLHQ